MATLDQAGDRDAAASYDTLAPYYDAYTRHSNYPFWVRALEALARRHGLRGRRALDLGCGTGESIGPLLELGYEVVGCDVSGEMVEQARRKLAGAVQLVVADMRALPNLGHFDLVWSVNDGVNYLTEPGDLATVFAGVCERLAPGGIFLFDLNTLRLYAKEFAASAVRTTDSLVMAWIGSGEERPAAGEVVETTLEIFEHDDDTGLWRRATSHHRQRHHPFDEARRALEEAGLRVLAVHGLNDEAAIEDALDERRHRKAIFVAIRGSGRR
jgi:SAM-dependent methyltransferase